MKLKLKFFAPVLLFSSFALLAIPSLENTSPIKILKVGDVDEDGGIILETGLDRSKLIKYRSFVTPTDNLYAKQKTYSLSNVGDIESTWDHYTGKGKMVAIIDSGFTYGHEDFVDKNGNSVFSDKSGYFYVSGNSAKMKLVSSDNWECMKHEYDSDYGEWDTHGSNVAGCAAGSLNGVGTVGIAPEATILACKIDFYDESINKAIKYAADQGADVINMSLGAYDLDDPHISSGDYQDSYDGVAEGNAEAVAYAISKGCIVVAAAGNESTSAKSYPACNDGVIGVGALAKNSSTKAASFSNFNKSTDTQSGNHNVDVMAPGVVWAPGLDGNQLSNSSSNYPALGYGETQGTSFASPITAGAATLWKQKYPNGTPAQFEADLYSRSVDMGNFTKFGNGRLDVYKLLDIEHEGITLSTTELNLNTRSVAQTVTATSINSTIKSWSSSNTSVVTVSGTTGSQTGTATITVQGAGSATVTVTSNDGSSAVITVNVAQYVAVTGITTTATSGASVGQGKTLKLGASVLPTNASNQTIAYSSANSAVASVSDKGIVTGVSIGQTTITLTAEGDVTLDFVVNVVESHSEEYTIIFKDAQSTNGSEITSYDDIIDSVEGDLSVSIGSPTKIFEGNGGIKLSSSKNNGSLTLNLGEELDITSIDANLAKYGTDSSALSINNVSNTMDDNSFKDYNYSFEGESTSTITMEATKRVYAHSLTITSGQDGTPVTSVSLNKNTLALETGEYETLTATVLPENATNKEVTWTSSNTNVATVSGGTVTAVGAGSATITVKTKSGSKTATCSVTVTDHVYPVTGVSLNASTGTVDAGGTLTLTETITPSNATNKGVSWSSSNEEVATVDNGVVTGVKAGQASITVTTDDGNFQASCLVTVNNVAVTGVSLNKTEATIGINGKVTLTPTIEPSNATVKEVTWSSSNESIATVDNGVVTGVVEGDATITVDTNDGHFQATCAITVSSTGGQEVFQKVESDSDFETGYYLIVYEEGSKALDGSLTSLDVTNNGKTVTIENDTIEASDTNKASMFTIETKGTGYSILSESGYYIGHTGSKNTLNTSTTSDYTNTISIEDGTASISCGSYTMRFNTANDQQRFRYFGSSNTSPLPSLYKLASGGAPIHDPELSVSTESLRISEKETSETITATTRYLSSGASVVWSIEDPTIAQLSATSGDSITVKGLKAGYTTITVSVPVDGLSVDISLEVTKYSSGLKEAYEAGEALSDGETTAEMKFTGIVTAKVGYSFYIQDGQYAMYIYCGSGVVDNYDIGDYVTVTSSITKYSGIIETTKIASTSDVVKLGETGTIEPVMATSFDSIRDLNQSILSSLSSATVKEITKAVSGSDISLTITIGGQDIKLFSSRHCSNNAELVSIISGLKVGDIISIDDMVTSYYSTGMQLALTEQSTVTVGYSLNAFLNEFMGNINCDASGRTAPTFATGYSWSEFKTLYGKLSVEDQATLTGAQAIEGGSELINRVAYRYDYIVGKYGEETYEDFMSRHPQKLIKGGINLFGLNSANSTAVIVLVSVIGLTVVGGTLTVFKSKNKEN
jgi:uncharacterized protein YjdB